MALNLEGKRLGLMALARALGIVQDTQRRFVGRVRHIQRLVSVLNLATVRDSPTRSSQGGPGESGARELPEEVPGRSTPGLDRSTGGTPGELVHHPPPQESCAAKNSASVSHTF